MSRPGRHEEGARTRERVLEKAARLIAAQGYSATSITQISKASQTNPASIYWAFGNKEGLFAAVMERAADAFFDSLDDLPTGDDPARSLTYLAGAFEGGPEFLRLLLVLSLERRDGDPAVLDAARRARNEARDRIASGFESAVSGEDSFQRRAICRSLADFTLMLLDGVFVASQIEPEATDLARAFELVAAGVEATGRRLAEDAGLTWSHPREEPGQRRSQQ